MNAPGPLGAFLQARRARLRPEDVGLRDLGPRRRVAGLRREELAQLAGVSVSYYARLEQGLSRGASAEVLDAIARALLLDVHEREHLDRLAGAARHAPRPRRPRPEKLADETRDLLRAVEGIPAIVLGRRTDVLAWNALGHALLAGHLDFLGPSDPARRPNMSRMLFLDPHCQELYADWKRKARAVVGNLRIAVGRHPEDALLAELIGELTMKSREFVALWKDHRVAPCDAASYELYHPVVGAVTVTQQALSIARSPEQVLTVCTTPAGSASEEALALLGQASGSRAPQADSICVPEKSSRQL
ncbi:helix-turn-helix domain-containing protein [Streptomyces sp. NBC_01431]|uniref:helix-turn-helix domain-containing protein n=1 Tax=Streptomyces sp. NBC_01431 TaxID=2903863 RepID=UPI002E36704E|nr:helix-turn-helix transcriptional regulator [Streptomyces sp. NBC_01431]